jgi:dihydrofolate reductase
MKVSIIVAIDEERGIGKNNDLLFKIPEDFKRLRALTNGHPIIMGRGTYDSIGRVLPNRTNIIVTRNKDFRVEGAIIAHSLEEAIQHAQGKEGEDEVFIFGGGQLFKESMEKGLIDRLYLTLVKGNYKADTFFPEYADFTKVIENVDRTADGYEYTFLTLEKE